MDLNRWKKIEDIFQEALDCPTAERLKFVREKSGGDENLQNEVEKLIARYETEEEFLESPVWTDSLLLQSKLKNEIASSLEEINPLPDEKSLVGRQIGVYCLSKELGRGGMGVVFYATRADGEFKQEVAIKLIKRGMDTDFILRRFRQERQIAATLNHPNIARLLDGGTTEDDMPYFVMEYVEGSTLFAYAEKHNLDLREKLRLFLRVCRAIIYAHRKRIIHRDIKPSNILVNDDGEPKLLDFGIAKILDPDLIHESAMPQTGTQMRLMTPEYASPEQVRGDEIDEASDQYSLGVLLYELLTGKRPYKFPSRAPHEIARVICEELPSEPSSGNFGKNITESGDLQFNADFCQKIDRIVLKTLRKNPSERYASVEEFAADIERFLRNENVRAESFKTEKNTTEENISQVSAVEFSDSLRVLSGQPKSIAVLPFKILDAQSAEAKADDGEFLGVGLADALITRLSNVRQFLVRPISSILSHAEQKLDSLAAGENLNVQFVLDGSIIKSDNRILISIELLNIKEQTIVWTQRFDEESSHVFEIEAKISLAVADALVPQLTGEQRRQIGKRNTSNADAYEAFLRGRYYWSLSSIENLGTAISFYRKAVEIDPEFALAHSAIANYYVWLGIQGAMPPRECYRSAKTAALRAIEIDDQLAEAQAALGLANLYGEFNWQESEKNILRAIELNSNTPVFHIWLAQILCARNRVEQSLPHVDRAIELDPRSFQNQNIFSWGYFVSRQYEKAIAKAEAVVETFPHNSHSWFSLAHYLNFVGRNDEALVKIDRAVELANEDIVILLERAVILAAAKRRKEAVEIVESVETETKNFSNYQAALVYCFLKDTDKAFEYLEAAYKNRESLIIWLGVEPSLDLLRADNRYTSLLERMNHPVTGAERSNSAKQIKDEVGRAEEETEQRKEKENSEISGKKNAQLSPRRRGIKQGIFIIIISILFIPVFLTMTVTAVIPPPLTTILFLLLFFGGIIRIFYALFFEWGKTRNDLFAESEQFTATSTISGQRATEENKKTDSSEPRKIDTGNQSVALKTRETEKSIAVMPFKTLNTLAGKETGDGGYLTIGLADALITRLSNVQQFIIRPTSSVMRYQGADADSFVAGRELKVDYILDGNILKTEKRIRVSIQLLDVANSSTVWAERFDEDLADFLTLEDSISKRVVESLLPHLSSGERRLLAKRGTDDAAAYEAYLRGRFYWNTFTEESFAKAFVAYHEAIAHDSEYALAYAGLADYYIWLGIYGVLAPRDCYPQAKAAALRAIEIDGELADAYAALGFAGLCGDFDWQQAEKNMLRAIELNPNHSVAHLWYSYVLQTAGRFHEGTAQAQRAVEIDSLTYTNYHVLTWSYYFAQRFNRAARQAAENVRKFPDIGLAYFTQSWVLRFLGRHQDALAASQRAIELSGNSLFVLLGHAQALAAAGQKKETEESLKRIFEQGAKQYLSYYQVALIYLYANEKDKALDALEKALEQHEGWLIWLRSEPVLDVLRDEPRFQKILDCVNPSLGEAIIVQDSDEKKFVADYHKTRTGLKVETVIQQSKVETIPERKSRTARISAFAAIGILIFAGLFFYFIYPQMTFKFSSSSIAPSEKWSSNFASTMNLKRLTDSGQAQIGAVSPDGKHVVYVVKDDDRQGLWLVNAESGENKQIVQPEPILFSGVTFSPDGQTVYYTAWTQNFINRNLYRVADLYGTGEKSQPQLVLEEVNSAISFSPDGTNLLYVSFDSKSRKSLLKLSDVAENGAVSAPRVLAEYAQPNFIRSNASFAPDGEKIVYVVGETVEKKETMSVYVFDLAANTQTKIGERTFGDVSGIAWRNMGSEIILSAAERDGLPYQLWLIEYPSGNAFRLTNDFSSYFDISLARDANALVTAKREKTSAVWIADLNAPNNAKQISTGVDRLDGFNGVNWTADNQILYIGGIGSTFSIMMINPDGTNNRPLDVNVVRPTFPLATKDSRFVIFADSREQGSSIWRYDTQSGALVHLTANYAVSPTLTPDGQIVYSTNNAARKISLHKISVEGGAETEITSNLSSSAVISPDGKLIACYYSGEETGNSWRLVVLSAETGKVLRVIAPPNTFNIQTPLERPLAWSRDSRSIYYVNDKTGTSNIFRVEAWEDKPPIQITNFPSGRIFDFSISPDGNRIVMSRGTASSDIVIFKSSR